MKPTSHQLRMHRRRQRGSALLLVMWLIAVLGMAIYGAVRMIAHDMDMTIAQRKAFRARQLAEMGINVACNPVVKPYDRALLNQVFGEGESFQVKIRGEGGRFNINGILQSQDRTLLERLFELWGLDNDQASMLTDRFLDWVDADSSRQLHGMEEDDYLELGIEGYPFNRPFYSLDEMLLVPGFEQVTANVPDWRDYFTIYSAGRLDLNAAEPKVIAAAVVGSRSTADPARDYPEALEEAMEFVEQLRWGPDGIEDTEDDTPVQDLNTAFASLNIDPNDPGVMNRFVLNDQTVHIESVGTVNDYRKRIVLILRNRTQGNPQILTREEVPIFQ